MWKSDFSAEILSFYSNLVPEWTCALSGLNFLLLKTQKHEFFLISKNSVQPVGLRNVHLQIDSYETWRSGPEPTGGKDSHLKTFSRTKSVMVCWPNGISSELELVWISKSVRFSITLTFPRFVNPCRLARRRAISSPFAWCWSCRWTWNEFT